MCSLAASSGPRSRGPWAVLCVLLCDPGPGATGRSTAPGTAARASLVSLARDIAAAGIVQLPDRLLEILVALPLLQQLAGRFGRGAVVEGEDLLDVAGRRRRLVRPRLAAQEEDRGEERCRNADRLAGDCQALAP